MNSSVYGLNNQSRKQYMKPQAPIKKSSCNERKGPVKGQHHISNNNGFNDYQLNQSSNLQLAKIAKSLEKSKKTIFEVVEKLTKIKNQVNYNVTINEFQRISLRTNIDSLINELNQEIVNTSDDIQKVKQGITISVDQKRTKRKVRRLESEAGDIISRFESWFSYNNNLANNSKDIKVNNFVSIDSSRNYKETRASSNKRTEPNEYPLNNYKSEYSKSDLTNKHRVARAASNEVQRKMYERSSNQSSKPSLKNPKQVQQPTYPQNIQMKSHLISQEDETWRKLEDLINIGSAQKVSLQQNMNEHNEYQTMNDNRENSLTPMRSRQFSKETSAFENRDLSPIPQLRTEAAAAGGQSTNSMGHKEIQQLRDQIKEIVNFQKEQTKHTTNKLENLEKQNSQLEYKVNQFKQEQTQIVTNFQQLENRYKEIIQENKQIKNELLDLRKNRPIVTKVTPDASFNMPFSKSSNINESIAQRETASNFFTPSKAQETDRTLRKNLYQDAPLSGSSSIFNMDKSANFNNDQKKATKLKGVKQAYYKNLAYNEIQSFGKLSESELREEDLRRRQERTQTDQKFVNLKQRYL